jgi:Flp pilus assembly CpaF family ATPase
VTAKEVEIISFVDRTTLELGHFASVAFKQAGNLKREEILIKKDDFLKWLNEVENTSIFDKIGHAVSEIVDDSKELLDEVTDAASKLVDEALEAVEELVTTQNVESDKPFVETVIDKVADEVKEAVDESTLSSDAKASVKTTVNVATSYAKDQFVSKKKDK